MADQLYCCHLKTQPYLLFVYNYFKLQQIIFFYINHEITKLRLVYVNKYKHPGCKIFKM